MQSSESQQLLKTSLPIGLWLEEVSTPHPYIPIDENYEKIGVQYLNSATQFADALVTIDLTS